MYIIGFEYDDFCDGGFCIVGFAETMERARQFIPLYKDKQLLIADIEETKVDDNFNIFSICKVLNPESEEVIKKEKMVDEEFEEEINHLAKLFLSYVHRRFGE